jgi:hypothetical protein
LVPHLQPVNQEAPKSWRYPKPEKACESRVAREGELPALPLSSLAASPLRIIPFISQPFNALASRIVQEFPEFRDLEKRLQQLYDGVDAKTRLKQSTLPSAFARSEASFPAVAVVPPAEVEHPHVHLATCFAELLGDLPQLPLLLCAQPAFQKFVLKIMGHEHSSEDVKKVSAALILTHAVHPLLPVGVFCYFVLTLRCCRALSENPVWLGAEASAQDHFGQLQEVHGRLVRRACSCYCRGWKRNARQAQCTV